MVKAASWNIAKRARNSVEDRGASGRCRLPIEIVT